MHRPSCSVAVIEGIDGSGKSFSTRAALEGLSAEYPTSRITMIDSDGLTTFSQGAVDSKRFSGLDRLNPNRSASSLGGLMLAGSYTLGRRILEARARQQDYGLIVSVRDPMRIDPAVYAGTLGPWFLGNLSPEFRLRFLSKCTTIAPPDLIIELEAEIATAVSNLASRSQLAIYEAAQPLTALDAELHAVVDAHHALYDTPVKLVDAMQELTIVEIQQALEPLIAT